MKNTKFDFYYSTLNDREKQLYNRIYNTVKNHGLQLEFDGETADAARVFDAVILDSPELFHVGSATVEPCKISFSYIYEKREAELLTQQMNKKLSYFEECRIKPNMNGMEKQAEVHSFMSLVWSVNENTDKSQSNIIGGVLKSKCTAEGLAKSYKYLCDRVGVQCLTVKGRDGMNNPTFWNITNVCGQWAHSDAYREGRLGVSGYDYFNMSDGEMLYDHSLDETLYPKCPENTVNLFTAENCVASDMDELMKILDRLSALHCFSVKLLFDFSDEQAQNLPYPDIGAFRYNPDKNILVYMKAMVE